MVALLAVTSCTTYRPLDQGSHVPWAKARASAQEPSSERTVTASSSEAAAAVSPERRAGASSGPVALRTDGGKKADIKVTEAEASRAAPAVERSGRVHRIGRGETLWSVAARYDLSVETLARANDLEPPYPIYAGQTLRLPAAATEPRSEAKPVARAEADGGSEAYVVQRGDNLTRIARRLDVSVRTLARANDIDPPYALRPGQRLVVPDPGGEVAVVRSGPADAPKQAPGGEPPALSGEGFLWPVEGKVLGRFGEGEDGRRRDGIDIAARQGTPVRAAEHGVVVYAGDAIRGYGRMILVRHDDGYVTTYAHNSALLVNVGEVVERGQAIARVGDTGDVQDARLHFELRKGREPVDPESVLVKMSTAVASSE